MDLQYFEANKVSLLYEICSAGRTDTVNHKIVKEHSLTGTSNSLRMVRYLAFRNFYDLSYNIVRQIEIVQSKSSICTT